MSYLKKLKYVIWCLLPIASFVCLKLNYILVSAELSDGSTPESGYTGYSVIDWNGTGRILGIMVILLFILNIAVIVTGLIGMTGKIIRNSVLKFCMLIEAVAYVAVTVVEYLNIRTLAKPVDQSISTISVGIGCYLNMGVALVAVVLSIVAFVWKQKDKPKSKKDKKSIA